VTRRRPNVQVASAGGKTARKLSKALLRQILESGCLDGWWNATSTELADFDRLPEPAQVALLTGFARCGKAKLQRRPLLQDWGIVFAKTT